MKHPPGHASESVETLLGQAADEYTQRLDRGERPEIEEYAERYPQISAVIREVFPALGVMRALDPAAARGPVTDASGGPFCEQLGDYRIIREIGRGGMGVVFEAEQVSLGRRVALKVLPFGAVMDQRHLRRFKREAQAVARLHHTNIVPVFSVGCERGVHYYAMQYIEGRPLSTLIEALRERVGTMSLTDVSSRDATAESRHGRVTKESCAAERLEDGSSAIRLAAPTPALGVRQDSASSDCAAGTPSYFTAVAQLGIQAAEALQHAHDHGVIHRDIKPANILLDASGHLWITDFGLAQVAADPGLTMPGDVLGTLRYMSPEQALGRRRAVDHRTDIYSLGMTLYELCGLRPAFAGRDRAELMRQIASDEPRALRRNDRAIPKELEAIIGKAIGKQPAERYASARELADDLARYLEHRPILAKRPTLLDRAAKWSRRHRTVLAAGVVTLNIAVLVLTVSTILILRERSETLKQRGVAETQRQVAETYSRAARGAVDRMLPWVSPEELGGAPHTRKVREALLDESLEAPSRSWIEKMSDTLARTAVGQAYLRVGHINALLRRDERAREAYDDAIGVFTSLTAEFPEVEEHRLALANSHASLATMLWERQRYAEAAMPSDRALALLEDVNAANPGVAENREALGQSLNLSGLIRRDLAKYDSARESLHRATEVWASLEQQFPDAPQYRRERARSLRNLGGLMLRMAKIAAAEDFVHQAIELQKELVAAYPAEPGYGAELAFTLRWWEQSQRVGAENAATEIEPDSSLLDRLVAELPAVPWYREKLADSYQNLDKALKAIGETAEAERAHQQAVDLQVDLARSFPTVPEYRLALCDLHIDHARDLARQWRITESARSYHAAVTILRDLIATSPAESDYRRRLDEVQYELDEWRRLTDIGGIIALGKRSPEGVAEAVERAGATDISGGSMPPFTRLVLAEYRMLGGDFEAGAAAIQRAIDEGAGTSFLRSCYFKSLGWAWQGCGYPDEARQAFEEALAHLKEPSAAALRNECPDPWTAAYFLDVITQDEYTERWRDSRSCGTHLGCFPWFYVGVRMELEGRLEDARAAYRTCVELGRVHRAHHTSNWAAYRLTRLHDEGP